MFKNQAWMWSDVRTQPSLATVEKICSRQRMGALGVRMDSTAMLMIGFDSDAYLDLHNRGMRLYREAMEDTVASEEAQNYF